MALKMAGKTILPIGIDIGTTMVKMAQLSLREGQFALIGSAVSEIPVKMREKGSTPVEYLSGVINKLNSANRFHGKKCIISLPAEATFVTHIRIPKVPDEQLDQAIRWAIKDELPYDVEQAVVRHQTVISEIYEDGQPMSEILVFCTSGETVKQYMQLARKARLEVVGLNVESCAISECFSRMFRRQEDQHRTMMFVDLGAFTTQVVITKGPKLVFARNLHRGGADLDHIASEALGITPPEAHDMRLKPNQDEDPQVHEVYAHLEKPLIELTSDLIECIEYYNSFNREHTHKAGGIERIVFVGGGAFDTRLCQELSYRLDIPAQIGNPLLRVDVKNMSQSAAASHPDWAVAVGLSVGATELNIQAA